MTPLLPVVGVAALLSAGITISAHYLRPARLLLIAIFKPLTTVLIIVVALLPGKLLTDPYARAIGAGLFFSLLGDILLLRPDRFIPGLGAFLLAHIAYIVAFHSGARAGGFLFVALALAGFAVGMLRYLWRGLGREMKAPVTVYVIMIGSMTALAIGRSLEQASGPRLLAAAGAALFMCSDAMLAINRFRKPFRWAELGVLSTYFAAQLLIALSV
jgi:alkylglycerol monooxygenase